MKIGVANKTMPYINCFGHVFFLSFWWQEDPLFGFVNKPKDYYTERGVILFGLWITYIHEW